MNQDQVCSKVKKHLLPLVEKNIDYSRSIARQFYRERNNSGIELEDFESTAMLGLCDAACRFDESKGGDFRTFIYLRIRGAMFDLLRRTGGIPRYKYYRLFKNKGTRKSELRADQSLNDSFFNLPIMFPQMLEMMDQMGMELHYGLEGYECRDLSYLGELTPEEAVMWKSTIKLLQAKIAKLKPAERKVIMLRYFTESSFEKMRKKFSGASKSTISRLHLRAIDNLRIMIEDQVIDCNKRQQVYNV